MTLWLPGGLLLCPSRLKYVCVCVCVPEALVPPWVPLGPPSLSPVLDLPQEGAAVGGSSGSPVPGNPWSFAGCLPGTGEWWLVVRDVRVDVSTCVGCVGRCACTEEACVGLCWVSALKRLVLAAGFCKCVFWGGVCACVHVG